MKFVGEALLLDVSCYDSKDKETGVMTKKYKYTFLVGDQKDNDSFISNPHVETYISDHILLNGDESVFDPIDIIVSIRSFREKVNGVYCDVQRSVYVVVDKVGA